MFEWESIREPARSSRRLKDAESWPEASCRCGGRRRTVAWRSGAFLPGNMRTAHAQRRRSRTRGGSSGSAWLGGSSTSSLGKEQRGGGLALRADTKEEAALWGGGGEASRFGLLNDVSYGIRTWVAHTGAENRGVVRTHGRRQFGQGGGVAAPMARSDST
jgi:hypothetical protein